MVRFVEGRAHDRNQISSLILPQLQALGRVALVGGAIRDIAYGGISSFKSDLDFVIYESDRPRFRSTMQNHGGKANKFGGYSIKVGSWRVDIWALEDTWAHTVGLKAVSELQDVLQCTFFNVDAVLFDIETMSLICKPNYFVDLNSNFLEVNLVENPNPTGSLVRALRRGMLWRSRFGPVLTKFVQEQMPRVAWSDLVALDAAAFRYPILYKCDPKKIEQEVNSNAWWEGGLSSKPFGQSNEQYRLPLTSEGKA